VTYEEDARIPLIVREPAGRRRLAGIDTDAVVLSIDIAPTILDLLGVEIPDEFEGRSLMRGVRKPDEPILTFGSHVSWEERTFGTQRGVRRGPWRLVFNTLDGVEELYDHREDPKEERNLAAAQPEPLAELRRVLAEYMAKPAKHNRVPEVNAADRERLRALGYGN
jgi:arylsulfatase A-like enzyme